MSTRSTCIQCPVFGGPEDLSLRRLPNYEEVMKYYQHIRLVKKTSNKELTSKEITQAMAEQLENLWKQASIYEL